MHASGQAEPHSNQSELPCLIEFAKRQNYVDATRVGMIGFSRGGGTTYGVLTCTDQVDAAITIGAPTDHLSSARRAEFDEHVYPHALRGYDEDPEGTLRSISAVHFAEHMAADTALLLLHGGADSRVAAQDSLALAQQLQQLHRPYRLKVFEGGSHALTENYIEVRKEIDGWLDRYVRDAVPAPKNLPQPLVFD